MLRIRDLAVVCVAACVGVGLCRPSGSKLRPCSRSRLILNWAPAGSSSSGSFCQQHGRRGHSVFCRLTRDPSRIDVATNSAATRGGVSTPLLQPVPIPQPAPRPVRYFFGWRSMDCRQRRAAISRLRATPSTAQLLSNYRSATRSYKCRVFDILDPGLYAVVLTCVRSPITRPSSSSDRGFAFDGETLPIGCDAGRPASAFGGTLSDHHSVRSADAGRRSQGRWRCSQAASALSPRAAGGDERRPNSRFCRLYTLCQSRR